MGLFSWFVKKNISPEVENGSRIIMMSTAIYLLNKYNGKYNNNIASSLASAVTNQLFNKEAGNKEGEVFLANNKSLINEELSKIKNEKNICYMISMIAHLRANIAGNSGRFTEDLSRWIDELNRNEIIIPKEKINMPKTIDDFFKQARAFESWVIQNNRV